MEDIKGSIRANSVSGGVDIADVTMADLIKAGTVSGSIRLDDISRAKKVKAETMSGSIKAEMDLVPGGDYELKSFSGSVVLDIPDNSSFELDASTMSGGIRCEIPVKGTFKRKSIQGIAGNGDASLKVSSFSGGLTIR